MFPRRSIVVMVTILAATACGSGEDTASGPNATDGIRVASAAFAESELLAEMYAQVIESTGIPVVRLGPVGPREIIAPALEGDLIDIVPEYLGSARAHFGATRPDPATDTSLNDLNLRLEPRGLIALRTAPAQDKDVFAVRSDTAGEYELESLSDLAEIAGTLRFGGTPECPDNPLCLAGLRDTYGLEFEEFIAQRSLGFTAEALRQGEIDVGQFFSTAGELEDPTFVVLDDDLGLQPAQNIVPMARADALERWGPAVQDVVERMTFWLTTRDLRFLNLRVANGEPIEEVARDWLDKNMVWPSS